MSIDIITFTFPVSNQDVRSVTIDGEPWFVAKDVCNVLEIGNITMAMQRLDSEQFNSIELLAADGKMRQQHVVNESGLYTLIMGSRKSQARDFQRWVTGEVLPSIRKTGSYSLVERRNSEIADLRSDMRELKGMMSRMLDIMERNEAKVATHDLLIATELEISMTELSAILGFDNVKTLTAALRDTGVLIKQRYPVTYNGKTYTRFRNTPRAKWRGFIVVRTQISGVNSVTVPYVRPSGVAPIHAHLSDREYGVAALPSVEEQREIIATVRARGEITSITDDC